jgi:phosphate transport system protein
LLSRYYERFADHAVEISRRIIFQATGQIPAGGRKVADRDGLRSAGLPSAASARW